MMKTIALFIFIISSSFAYECIAQKEGLKGRAKLSYIFWDLYNLAYYQESPEVSNLRINYLRDIDNDKLNMGWEKGLKENIKNEITYQVVLSWLTKVTPSVKKGDCLDISINKEEVKISLNGKELAQNKDRNIASYVLSPWLGENPVDSDVKKKLLGK